MKDALEKLDPRNMEEWTAKIQQVWDSLDISLLESLIKSMPQRIQACIDKKGGIKY
jgi:hypothetical protein